MSSPISGFTAIPNPQMLAFMPIQSYLMMYFAGAGWQIGKRKISAIPNDKFNVMSAKDLLEGFTADLRETIPTLERSLQDITPLIRTLIEQYGDFIRVAIDTIPQLAQNIVGGQAGTNLSGNLQGFNDILTWISKQLPNLPSAEAKMMAKQIEKSGGITLVPPPFSTGPGAPKPFQGPEINPVTGETTPFVKHVKSLPPPAPHIVPRPVSNVSLQSLQLERNHLENLVRVYALKVQNKHQFSSLQQKNNQAKLLRFKQDLANFLQMHGTRF